MKSILIVGESFQRRNFNDFITNYVTKHIANWIIFYGENLFILVFFLKKSINVMGFHP
jgi:hypothetical protein